MTAIASLLTNAFKTVQPSAKDKEDTYRRADADVYKRQVPTSRLNTSKYSNVGVSMSS